MTINELLKDADMSNFPNHITFYGEKAKKQVFASSGYNEYRKRWVQYPRDSYVGDFPLHLDIEATNCCNLRCAMCFVDFNVDTGKFIDLQLVKKVIDEGSLYRLPSIKFNYRGEPLLHPQLVEMVRYAKKRGVIEVQFNTNATLLTSKKSEALISAGLDKMIVSMDGITAETYNRLRVGADYDAVLANVEEFIALRDSKKLKKPILRVQMVCMRNNANEVYEFVRYWRGIADQVGLIRFKKQREGQGDEGLGEYAKFAKPCHQLFQRLVIGSDGKVTMCCGDTKRKILLGDAYKTKVAEIWRGDALNKIRALHREHRFDEIGPCRYCPINKHSKGAEWDWLFNGASSYDASHSR